MKTETRFTPGPWYVGPPNDIQCSNVGIHGGSDGYEWVLADLCNEPEEFGVNQVKNAHLMSAAPDMYAALKPFAQKQFHEVLAGNTQGDDSILWERNGARLTIGDFRRAADALAKAEGKS